VANLTPAEGVLPFSIVAEPWMDGATAQRWVAIPEQAAIDLNATDPTASKFPDGTVFIKHLTFGSQKKALETQLLHLENGTWSPYSYLWNDDGKDASLVESQGANYEVLATDDPKSMRTWHVGAETECRLCHSVASGSVLGFTARQLDRIVARSGNMVQQLELLSSTRVLAKKPADAHDKPKFVNPYDDSGNLDDRARSYLHMNCGICHNLGGPATISFFAHRDYPYDQLRITKHPGIGTFGIQSPRLIAAGDPYSSIILYRIAKLGYGRMPYVGSRVVDSRGVALIESWIKSMAPQPDAPLSAPARPASHEGKLLQHLSVGGNPQPDAIDELLKTTEGSLALAAAMHRELLSNADVQYVRESTKQAHGDARGLFDHFIPETERRKTLGMNPDVDLVLELDGDRGRGELIFLSDNARCRSCHDEHDPGKSLGPALSDIRGKYKKGGELLKHIISPSLQMDEKFITWNLITTNGRVFTGILIFRDKRQVHIRLADKSIAQIDRTDIEAMRKSDRSIMPDGVLSDLTPQEAADLMAFLLKG
jgi:putative heme-binding domain-containing protein